MKIGERYLIIAEFLQKLCHIGDFCGRHGEEWLHVQLEEQLQKGDATQTGQAEHLTMQNARQAEYLKMQDKQNIPIHNAGKAEFHSIL